MFANAPQKINSNADPSTKICIVTSEVIFAVKQDIVDQGADTGLRKIGNSKLALVIAHSILEMGDVAEESLALTQVRSVPRVVDVKWKKVGRKDV